MTGSLKIFSQNCHAIPGTGAMRRLAVIAQKISELHPDIIFLQEVILKSYLRHLKLPDYHLLFVPGNVLVRGGLVMLVKKSIPVVSVRFKAFAKQGRVFSRQLSDRMLGKGFLCVQTNEAFLINTHLVYAYRKPFASDRAQERQLKQLMEYVRGRSEVMIAGDFNFAEDSPYYQMIAPPLRDMTRGLGETDLEDHVKYDFIFTKGMPIPRSSASCVEYPTAVSDHKGIVCEVQFLSEL